jgi:drug/metabolite transporter (DMT)-like permease
MYYQMLILLSIFGWGVGSFISKLATNVMHPIMITTVVMITDLLLLPLAFIFLKFDRVVPPMGILLSVLIAIFMAMGTLGFSYALKAGGGAGETTVLTSLYPALTLALSCMFLSEPFTIKKGLGVMLAVGSFIILAQK